MKTFIRVLLGILLLGDAYLVVKTNRSISALQGQVDGLRQDLQARDDKLKKLLDPSVK